MPISSLFWVSFAVCWTSFVNAQRTNASESIIFPRDNEIIWRTLSNSVHLIGVSVLAYCLARRTQKQDLLSWKGLSAISGRRWIVILIFADSWLFIFTAGLLISGIGLSLNEQACSAGVFLCIFLYAVSKILIYCFLVEKVYLVHPHPSHKRLQSPAYRLCMLFVIGYFVVLGLMVWGRITYIRNGYQHLLGMEGHIHEGDDGACVIGLGKPASLTLLIYDLILNVFFTCMFLYPVYRSKHLTDRLKRIAKRTLIAALVALITSAINVCILTVLHGQELGWVCLASCGADTTINALAIFAVTGPLDDRAESSTTTSHNEPKPKKESSGTKPSTGKTVSPAAAAGAVRVVNHANVPTRVTGAFNQSLRRMLGPPKPYPSASTGTSTSARGILETTDAGTRDTGRFSVRFTGTPSNPDRTIGSIYEMDGDVGPAVPVQQSSLFNPFGSVMSLRESSNSKKEAKEEMKQAERRQAISTFLGTEGMITSSGKIEPYPRRVDRHRPNNSQHGSLSHLEQPDPRPGIPDSSFIVQVHVEGPALEKERPRSRSHSKQGRGSGVAQTETILAGDSAQRNSHPIDSSDLESQAAGSRREEDTERRQTMLAKLASLVGASKGEKEEVDEPEDQEVMTGVTVTTQREHTVQEYEIGVNPLFDDRDRWRTVRQSFVTR